MLDSATASQYEALHVTRHYSVDSTKPGSENQVANIEGVPSKGGGGFHEYKFWQVVVATAPRVGISAEQPP